MTADVIVVGGGPSGSVASRLLALWGHQVSLLTRPTDPARALANSLPPSTRKLLVQTGALEAVERVGVRTYGNTVWWGPRDGHVRPFSRDSRSWGYQVDRARLDPELLQLAAGTGVRVDADARVQQVTWSGDTSRVSYTSGGEPRQSDARLVLDCSGRAGVMAVPRGLRKQHPGGRMQALVGVWDAPGGWQIDDPSHTFIETSDDGWAWSLPTSATTRHIGLMVDGATSRLARGESLDVTYHSLLALLPRLRAQAGAARLVHVFASDASVYTAASHAGDGFVLVGDAGSTLNPLSSFGIKKALTSAWLAAVVANTVLRHPAHEADARAFFTQWESDVWHLNLRRSRDFAREALERHPSPFWAAQAAAPLDETRLPIDEDILMAGPDVRRAHDVLRQIDNPVFSIAPDQTGVSAPLVRGDRIVREDAVRLGPGAREVLRYVRGVDLVALARLAPSCPVIPLMLQQYTSRYGHVSLPDFLAALSLLVARDVLHVKAVPASTRA